MHACPSAQVPGEQPAMHRPPWQISSGGEHWSSVVHSGLSAMQRPGSPVQVRPKSHSPGIRQGMHSFAVPTCTQMSSPQSVFVAHGVPVSNTHRPAAHVRPVPHSVAVLHAVQAPPRHNCAPHSASASQARHRPSVTEHTCPAAAHSASVQAVPTTAQRCSEVHCAPGSVQSSW